MLQHRLDKLADFLGKARFIDQIGPEFELGHVEYTAPTDAVAEFHDHRPESDDWATVIATTDDNWAHAARIFISDELADLVDYFPLGNGAVAIKAQDQSPRKNYPPFVLYPDGQVKPLRVTEPRALDAGNAIVRIDPYYILHPLGTEDSEGVWAADIDSAEIFPLTGSPTAERGVMFWDSTAGSLWAHVPGRDEAMLRVSGYKRNVGDGVLRFETSTDTGHSWSRTDVLLPLGRKPIWRYADVSLPAVGPKHLQAIAMADSVPDLPLYLWELWRTDDEKEFRRVPLPRNRMPFAGMAFASDGALLLAEVEDAMCSISSPVCNRTGRIWRLPHEGNSLKLMSHAPTLFGPHGWGGLDQSGGGLIIARTGLRTIALSDDGYTWANVTPG